MNIYDTSYIPSLQDKNGNWHPPIDRICLNCMYKAYIEGAEESGILYCDLNKRIVKEDEVCTSFDLNMHIVSNDIEDEVEAWLNDNQEEEEQVEHTDTDGVVRLL